MWVSVNLEFVKWRTCMSHNAPLFSTALPTSWPWFWVSLAYPDTHEPTYYRIQVLPVCVCVCVCVREIMRERGRERGRGCVWVCMCVCVREIVWEREREREREIFQNVPPRHIFLSSQEDPNHLCLQEDFRAIENSLKSSFVFLKISTLSLSLGKPITQWLSIVNNQMFIWIDENLYSLFHFEFDDFLRFLRFFTFLSLSLFLQKMKKSHNDSL